MMLSLHIVPLLCHDTLSLKHLLLPHFVLFLFNKLHSHSFITLLHSKLMRHLLLLLLVWHVSLIWWAGKSVIQDNSMQCNVMRSELNILCDGGWGVY